MTTSTIPAFDVVDPSGRRRRATLGSAADSVADLGRALDVPAEDGLVIDGVALPAQQRLVTVDTLRHGSAITAVDRHRPTGQLSADGVTAGCPLEFAVVTGPACQPWRPLPVGRHGIGRSSHATIRLSDPLVEAHHGLLDVELDGSTRFVQLTGRIPVIGDESLAIGASRVELRKRPRDPQENDRDRVVSMGGSVAPIAGDPWRREVRRGAHRVLPNAPPPPLSPAPPAHFEHPSATSLIGAFVGVVGAATMAVVLGQVMFAFFALFGAVASLATWLVGVINTIRRRRHASLAAASQFDEFVVGSERRRVLLVERHRLAHPDVIETFDELREPGRLVWSRRPIAGELSAVLGRGSLIGCAEPVADAERHAPEVMAVLQRDALLVDVAVPITFGRGEAVALHGPVSVIWALARSLVVQLATWFGPADLRLVVVSSNPGAWSWVEWLPHSQDGAGAGLVLDARNAGDLARLHGVCSNWKGRSVVVVVDDPSVLAVRTGHVRRFVSSTQAITLVVVDLDRTVPAVCRRTLSVSGSSTATWLSASTDGLVVVDLHVAGIDEHMAAECARQLAPLYDPEDVDTLSSNLPTRVTLSALDAEVVEASDGEGPARIARRWTTAGRDPSLRAPIGMSSDGVVEIDLVADGPHALIAGTTGSGKSELLRTLVVSMAARVSPQHLNFILVDYKGGSTFDACVDLPHTVGVVTDLDDGLAERALVSLDAEVSRRELAFRTVGVADLGAYRTCDGRDPMPRLVVLIDEFASLAHDLPDFLGALVGIAQRGRSLGIHLVLATQRPSGVINDDIRANTNLRLALRMSDRGEACDVVGDEQPSLFSRSHPGRAAIRLGPDELIVFQTGHSSGPIAPSTARLRVSPAVGNIGWPGRVGGVDGADGAEVPDSITELAAAVSLIRRAAATLGCEPSRRPWLDPLPAILDPDVIESDIVDPTLDDAIGLIDDPANQARAPLRWDTTAGNLMLVGALGTGLSSTVVALVAATCRRSGPEVCHVYVIDGVGNPALEALTRVAHCGGVVRVGEHERVDRLLQRVISEIDRRQAVSESPAEIKVVLFIDGLSELRRSLDSVERLTALAMLDRILDAGPAVGVVSCVTTDGTSGGSTASVADRWVFRVGDPSTARSVGLRGAVVDVDHPGRLRIASSGLEAQVAWRDQRDERDQILVGLPLRIVGSGPADITTLAAQVDRASLPSSSIVTTAGRPIRHLVIGLRGDNLDPASLLVPAGDHVFVGGAARTGKTSTLDEVAGAWCQIEGPESVVRWVGGTELRDRLAADPSTARLVIIDDADRVSDSDGVIAEILGGAWPAVTIAAAARVEAVRSAYGHWTREITRSRSGVIMTSVGEVDGELLGANLPRRSTIPPRPGLAWMIDSSGHRLVQVAGRLPT